jgi:regulatory protein
VQQNPKKILDLALAREKIRGYCAYQERNQREVKQKLLSYGLLSHIADDILIELIQDGFLNEERYAQAFARGKVNIKGWGRRKIEMELKMRGISTPCISKALSEIDADSYSARLASLAEKKWDSLKGGRSDIRKQKVITYLLGKGYEIEMIKKAMSELLIKE